MKMDAFMARIEPDQNTGCWLWSGATTPDGYGVVLTAGKRSRRTRAHRWSLTLLGYVVPEDKVVMHKCDTPLCCNPAHLQIGTAKENVHDMISKGRRVKASKRGWKLAPGSRAKEKHNQWGHRKTHCKNGHAFLGENIGRKSNGAQRCRACDRARYHAKKGA